MTSLKPQLQDAGGGWQASKVEIWQLQPENLKSEKLSERPARNLFGSDKENCRTGEMLFERCVIAKHVLRVIEFDHNFSWLNMIHQRRMIGKPQKAPHLGVFPRQILQAISR